MSTNESSHPGAQAHPAPEHPVVVATTTVASQDEARALARGAVAARLAACVQIEPIESVYRWKGELAQEPEWRLSFKTATQNLPTLRAWVHANHPYELPQWLVLQAASSAAYQDWVAGQTEVSSGA